MQIYRGKGVAGGIAVGRIFVFRKREAPARRYSISDEKAELERFEKTVSQASRQLDALYAKASSSLGEPSAAIFQAHQVMLEDADYLDMIRDEIRTKKVNAEYAVETAANHFCTLFSAMQDDYMRERAMDVKDVSRRLVDILAGSAGTACRAAARVGKEPTILLAWDLEPSDTIQFEGTGVLSFVTARGSVYSHTAILAKTMGIPALTGLDAEGLCGDDQNVADWERGMYCLHGHMAVADGYAGVLYVDPDEKILKKAGERRVKDREKKLLLQALKDKETVTEDGRRVRLCANIGSIRDLKQAMESGAEGVGLFRSEFLYLDRKEWPGEEAQFSVYREAAEAMAGKRVVIRTLDIGADKQAGFFPHEKEENPAMGCRAIRICLKRPDIFKTQLKALYRAALYGRLAVLYPMITSVREMRQIRAMEEEAKRDLKEKGTAFGELERGIMIETPAAALISDLLAVEVDFFSIGTNDLTQYALAVDRQNGRLDAFYDPHHTAVLRMIEMTVRNAHEAGIWCGICGELASDVSLTEEFLQMGVDELSVPPGKILPMRKFVREMGSSHADYEE